MCGRFALNENPKKLAEHFHIYGDFDLSPSWNIAPSHKIYTITAKDSTRNLHRMKWGFIPSWTEDPSIGNKPTNARGETVAEKPLYRNAFKYHRCIIPASGFFEWETKNGVKYPWYISLKSGDPMAFAGIWDTWHPKEEAIESCSIITTSPNSLMEAIHDRMPVILSSDEWEEWLSPSLSQTELLLPMIRSHESEAMQAWRVTRELNKVGLRNDAGLIEPV